MTDDERRRLDHIAANLAGHTGLTPDLAEWLLALARREADRADAAAKEVAAREVAEVEAHNHAANECAARLGAIAAHGRETGTFGGVEVEAAAQAILALRGRVDAAERKRDEARLAEVERLRAALRPFADYAAWADGVADIGRVERKPDDWEAGRQVYGREPETGLTLGDCRRARKALELKGGDVE